jgi:hypothetical protein
VCVCVCVREREREGERERESYNLESKVSSDIPRGDAINTDVVLRPLTSQVLGQHVHRRLGCRVDGACTFVCMYARACACV